MRRGWLRRLDNLVFPEQRDVGVSMDSKTMGSSDFKKVLSQTEHRPYPLPEGSWVLRMAGTTCTLFTGPCRGTSCGR